MGVVVVWILVLGLEGFWRSRYLWDGGVVGVGSVVCVSAV